MPAPPPTETRPFPTRLSETGLFARAKDHTPAKGLIPYSVNSQLWSDGAEKERFLALPGGSQIELPDVIYIPIEVLLGGSYGIPANSVLYDATALVGVVSVSGNEVYFEDQPLTDPEIAALEEACRNRGFR